MFVGSRASFELVLSNHSLKEVEQRKNPGYLQWAFDVVAYWREILVAYEENEVLAFNGRGAQLVRVLESSSFGYLSKQDKELLKDALELECEAFVTMDRRLSRNAGHLERNVPIRLLEPVAYWDLLRPWAPLFA